MLVLGARVAVAHEQMQIFLACHRLGVGSRRRKRLAVVGLQHKRHCGAAAGAQHVLELNVRHEARIGANKRVVVVQVVDVHNVGTVKAENHAARQKLKDGVFFF